MNLRNPLRCSLLLNGALASSLAFHALSPSRSPQAAAPAAFATPVSPPLPAPAAPEPPLFQWSSLESEDYPTYVANLRKIGCPERTLRDLIHGELDGLYFSKQAELAAKGLSPREFNAAVESLRQEKLALLNQLLGLPRSVAAVASAPSATSAPSPIPSVEPPAAARPAQNSTELPLLFQPISESKTFKVTQQQAAIVEGLRQSFVREIGGPNQNPADPEYSERWNKALETANQRIRGQLGEEFYMRFQIESARRKSARNSL
ncbi:MAG: hypothetical protein ACFUZC_22340 [Chthoniobacteraceae bacterium]